MSHANNLPQSTPESQGISSSAILAFLDEAQQSVEALHSLMLLRHGHLVAAGWWEPYGPEHPHMLFSLSKSFTATAVGLAVAEGRLSVDDSVLGFFSEDAPARVSANLAAMRVRHLLTMTTGHTEDTLSRVVRQREGNWARAFLRCPVNREPGTHFVYNSGASYMLSAIVQKVTGQKLVDYLQPRLFAPLGITGATWEECPRGVNTGGWGLNVKTEDIARFGQLYLQKGMWQGQQIIPALWVAEATRCQVPNDSNPNPDWHQGYGYQFWRCRYGAYRGDGAFGQFCIVMPDQDAVVAITSGVRNMQAVLDLVWKHLLPAMQEPSLPEDAAAQALRRRLANLMLPPARGQHSSPMASVVSGKEYVFLRNDMRLKTLSFDFGSDTCTCTFQQGRRKDPVVCGSGAWVRGVTRLESPTPRPVAASGAWTADDTYQIKLCFYETPFRPTIVCRFAGDEVAFDFRPNVAFGPLERPILVGRTT